MFLDEKLGERICSKLEIQNLHFSVKNSKSSSVSAHGFLSDQLVGLWLGQGLASCFPHLASHFLTSGNTLNRSTTAQATILSTATSLSAPGLIKASSVQSLSRVWVFSRQVQFSSVAKSGPTLGDPRDCSTLGSPVLHYLPEFAHKAPYVNLHFP